MRSPAIPLLSLIDPNALEGLLARSVTRSIHRGGVLFLAGESRERVHFVLDGSFILVGRTAGGTESVIGFASQGRLLDEVGTIDSRPHTCDAIAAANATVLGLDIVAFGNEIRRSPAVAIELVRQLEARLDWMAAAATERATCAVAGRVAGRLLDLAGTLGDTRNGVIEFELPVRQEQLALLAATTRESACKTMRALKQQGILDYRGRRLRIFRPEALAYLRCGERVSGPSRSTDEEVRPRSRSTSGT